MRFAISIVITQHSVNTLDAISALQSACAVAFGAIRYFWVVLSIGRQLHYVAPIKMPEFRQMSVVEGGVVCQDGGDIVSGYKANQLLHRLLP